MEGLKNIVVLKNLPSNIIEEAFIIVKENFKIEKVEINNKGEKRISSKKGYVIKEAEEIIKNYEKEAQKESEENIITEIQIKYKKLKVFTFWLGAVALMGVIVNFF